MPPPRKSHCKRGHEMKDDKYHTIIDARGYRKCRACHRDRQREYARRKRARECQTHG